MGDFVVQALATLVGALAAFALEALRQRRDEKQTQMQKFKAAIFVLILHRTFLRGLYANQLEPQKDVEIRAYSLHPILTVPPKDRFDVSELAFLLSTKEAHLLNVLATAESQYLSIAALVEQRNALHVAFQSRMEMVRAQTGQFEGTIDDIRAMAGPVLSRQLEMLTDALYDNITHAIGFNRDTCIQAVDSFKRLYPGEHMFGFEDLPLTGGRKDSANG